MTLRWRMIKTILGKEFLAFTRDKMALILAFGVPLVFLPLSIGLYLLAESLKEDLVNTKQNSESVEHKMVSPDRDNLFSEHDQGDSKKRQSGEKSKPNVKNKIKVLLSGDVIPELIRELNTNNEFEIIQKNDEWDQSLFWEMPKEMIMFCSDLSIIKLFQTRSTSKTASESLKANVENMLGLHSIFSEVEQSIENKEYDVLIVSKKKDIESSSNPNLKMWIFYDDTNNTSKKGSEFIGEVLQSYTKRVLKARLESLSVSPEFIEPLEFHVNGIATLEKKFLDIVGVAIFLFSFGMIFVNGFTLAASHMIEERENGTLASLLGTPINYVEIIIAKFIVIVTLTSLGVYSSLFSLYFLTIKAIDAIIPFSFFIPLNNSLFILLILLPYIMLHVAIYLCTGLLAKNSKAHGFFILPVLILFGFPVVLGALGIFELTPLTAFIPSLNISLIFSNNIAQPFDLEIVFIVCASNFIWATFFLLTAAWLFSKESIVIGDRSRFIDLFTFDRYALPEPTAGSAFLVFLMTSTMCFYFGLSLAHLEAPLATSIPQIFVILGLPIFISWYFRMDFSEVFNIKRPTLMAILGSTMIGLSLFLSISSWSTKIIEPPSDYASQVAELMFGWTENKSFWLILLTMATIPAFCEEFAFRGFVLTGLLKRFAPPLAIFLSAIFFGLIHFSVYKFIPTFLIGIVLGYAVWKSKSIWVGVLIHFVHNATLMVLYVNREEVIGEIQEIPILYILTAIASSLIGLLLIHIFGARKVSLQI